MAMQPVSNTTTYEQTLLSIIQTLPTERIRQFIDFARFLQLQTSTIANLEGDEEQNPPRRQPHPTIAGKGKTLGDLISPIVDESEWESLQ